MENKSIVRIMRITFFLLLTTAFCTFAENTHSQNARVTINKSNTRIDAILNEIENQTDYLFIYDNQVDTYRKATVKVKNESVSNVLGRLFRDAGVEYKLEGTHILLTKQNAPIVQQQKKNISGKVVDNFGDPIIGANVVEKGTLNGVITDLNGVFQLTVSEGASLQITYIGFAAREIAVGTNTTFHIELAEDTKALDEVVVIGYGAVKKSDLTGAVSSVSASAFKDQPLTRVEDALQGRMAGVDVQTVSGAPGSDIKIRVRGASSINKSNDPLYVIDGIVVESGLSGLNTADIASIEVLKDASSTAIYGSRGANGVVLITTRRGSSDHRSITFDADFGFATLAKKYDLLNAYEYAQALNDVRGAGTISDSEMEAYRTGAKGIDWQDQIFQTGFYQNYKLSISGGNKETQYFISGNVLDQDGITVYSNYKRYTFRSNVSTDVTDWFNITADLKYSQTKAHNNAIHNQGKGNTLWLAINYSPTMEMMDENGTYIRDPYNSIQENPYGLLKENDRDWLSNSLNGMVDLRFKLAKGLTFSAIGGIDYRDSKSYSFDSNKVVTTNYMNNRDNYRVGLQSTNNLTYMGKWNDHSLTATGVFEVATTQFRTMSIGGNNLLTESVRYWNIDMVQSQTTGNSYTESSIASWVGRLMYSYQNKYSATVTFRADGSSKFSDKKWGYFPSAALAWNIAEEDFIKNLNVFDQLKLRGSFGIIGNQAINSYDVLGLLSGTKYSYGTDGRYTGYWSNSYSTPDLTWEKIYQTDIGLDVSVLNQRLNFTMDWYKKKTKDTLLQKAVPGYNGGGSYWVNKGEIENTGFEFSVNAMIIQNRNVSWNSSLNVSWMKNKVLDLAGEAYILGAKPAADFVDPCTIIMPGQPIGTLYGYNWLGLDANGNNMYEDLDGNRKIDTADQMVLGKSTPDAIFGWNNMISWKNWEFNVFFNASVGAKKMNLTKFATASAVGDSRFITLRDAYFDGFDRVGRGASYPSLTSDGNKNYGNSSRWVESADFLRLKNISIAYTFPKAMTHFADVRLSFSCQNLFTITGYSGMDPESSTVGDGQHADMNNGLDLGAYPIPRTYTLGVRVNF